MNLNWLSNYKVIMIELWMNFNNVSTEIQTKQLE